MGTTLNPPLQYFGILMHMIIWYVFKLGARYSSVVRAFAHGAMGRRIDPSW